MPGMNWRWLGVWLEAPSRVEPTYYGKLLRDSWFRYAIVKIHDGVNIAADEQASLDNGWARAVRKQGVQVGGWGVQQDRPVNEAVVAAERIEKYGLQFYVSDAEGPHKDDWPGGDSRRSLAFVRPFRERLPKLPCAFSTFGAAEGENLLGSCVDDRGPMRFKPWKDAGFRFKPQAYYPVGDSQNPLRSYRQAVAASWPRSWIHLVVGNYDGYGPEAYIDGLRQVVSESKGAARGFSVFIAEQMREEDYQEYGRAAHKFWLTDDARKDAAEFRASL